MSDNPFFRALAGPKPAEQAVTHGVVGDVLTTPAPPEPPRRRESEILPTVFGWTFIEPELVVSGSAAVSWTRFRSAVVPLEATAVILQGRFENSSGSGTWRQFLVRRNSYEPTQVVGETASGAASDTTAYGNQGIFPCDGPEFDYSVSHASWNYTVYVVGYWVG